MQVQPYLSFEGRCEEALEFYKQALGAKVDMIMRNKESPELPPSGKWEPGTENKILHSSFRVGDSVLMATDGYNKGQARFEGINLAITAGDAAEAGRFFDALAKGGNVKMPLTKTFFSPAFGMVADKFGVGWMVMAQGQPA